MNLSGIRSRILFIYALSIINFYKLYAQVPLAFPEAQGFGRHATGGRGGEVVTVLNLADNGEGSLRWALDQHPTAPITIVFRISGIIDLKSNLKINRSNVTISGQTAPGDGICLKGRSLIINGARGRQPNHGNIIIRYIRSRPGGNLKTGLYGIDIENASNIMLDHCSFSWANEECAAMYDVTNITMQWCIISEGLYNSGHSKGNRAYGGVWGGQNVSYHHNLIANQYSRSVRFNGSRAHDTLARVDYRNNVIFNWGSTNACYGGEVEIANGLSEINLINNYYIPGPATSADLKFVKANYNLEKVRGIGRWYINGNYMKGSALLSKDNLIGLDLSEIPMTERHNAISSRPFMTETSNQIEVQSAAKAFKEVLRHAGASRPRRDQIDNRVISYLKGRNSLFTASLGKGGIIDSPDNVGGWPAYFSLKPPTDSDLDGMPNEWEKRKGLDPSNYNDRNLIDKSGLTMLEVYLNSI